MWPVAATTASTAFLSDFGRECLAQQGVEVFGFDGSLGGGRAYHHDELAARFGALVVIGAGEGYEIGAADFLVQLGKLAAHRGFAVAERGGEIVEHGGDARPGFEEHQRRRHLREFGEPRAPRLLPRRQESFEEEPVGRQARARDRRHHRGGARHGSHHVAGGLRLPHQLEAGIGDQRRAGVGHERHRVAGIEPRQQLRPCRGGVVVVIGDERRVQAIAVEQPVGHASVLAGHHVDAGQDFERTQRHVPKIADRGRHEIQSRRRPCSLDVVREHAIVPCRAHCRGLRLGRRLGVVRGGHGIQFVFATGRGGLFADLRTIRRFADTMPEWHTEVIAICRMRR